MGDWRALLTTHARLWRRLDDELRAECELSLYEYAALLELAEAPERRMRMSRLADNVFITPSGVTRLIDRLEKDGLVERRVCPSDRRGSDAVLTAKGLTRLRAASDVHLHGIETYYFERVSTEDQQTVGRAMRSVAAGITEDAG